MGKREIFGDSLVDYIRVCFATRRKKQERERERERERGGGIICFDTINT